MGSGFYSNKLSYEQWYKFNNAQRAHQNFVEWATPTFALLLISGIYFPIESAAIGLGIIVFRLIYSLGYRVTGPQGRLIGVLGALDRQPLPDEGEEESDDGGENESEFVAAVVEDEVNSNEDVDGCPEDVDVFCPGVFEDGVDSGYEEEEPGDDINCSLYVGIGSIPDEVGFLNIDGFGEEQETEYEGDQPTDNKE
ncbi:unnamed protein product [Sphagnum balticum]